MNVLRSLLLWVLRDDPAHTEALRILARVAARLGARALSGVVDEVLSLFEPHLVPPDAGPLANLATFYEGSPSALLDGRSSLGSGLLRIVWEGALPLFRRHPRDFDVTGADRATALTPRPTAQAFADAGRVLEVMVPQLYIRQGATSEVLIAETQPPAVIVGGAVDDEGAVGRFRVARALYLAQPSLVLISALGPERRRALIESIGAAFGPPALAAGASRAAVALGAELWNTIPARQQNQLRILLAAQGAPIDPVRLQEGVFEAAAKAGLLVAGSVRASVQGLATDDASLRGVTLGRERDFVAACRASAPLRALIGFALSTDYLAARARADAGRAEVRDAGI